MPGGFLSVPTAQTNSMRTRRPTIASIRRRKSGGNRGQEEIRGQSPKATRASRGAGCWRPMQPSRNDGLRRREKCPGDGCLAGVTWCGTLAATARGFRAWVTDIVAEWAGDSGSEIRANRRGQSGSEPESLDPSRGRHCADRPPKPIQPQATPLGPTQSQTRQPPEINTTPPKTAGRFGAICYPPSERWMRSFLPQGPKNPRRTAQNRSPERKSQRQARRRRGAPQPP